MRIMGKDPERREESEDWVADPRAMIYNNMEEKDFLAQVIKRAKDRGWLVQHTYDSRRSEPGFPDLVMARGGTLIFAELKSRKGRVSSKQQEWLDALPVGDVRVYVWRPAELESIKELLK